MGERARGGSLSARGEPAKADGDDLRTKVALSCRILAHFGLVRDIIGHVSARIPGTREMVIRCRGEDERGLAFTTRKQVRRIGFDGSGNAGKRHALPLELPIHGAAYERRSEVNAVVHAHPRFALICGLAGIELKPIFGAYDPNATPIAVEGVPVFPRAVLIDTPELGAALFDAMGEHSTCLMRGHGVTVVGSSVEQATIRALKLETLAEVSWRLAASGRTPEALPPEELELFVARRGGVVAGAEQWLWRHYVRVLGANRR